MRRVSATPGNLTHFHTIIYLATVTALYSASAFAQPYSGESLVVDSEQEISYDAVTVDWTAKAGDEAGVLIRDGGTLQTTGDFNLTATGATDSSLQDQSGLLVGTNGKLIHTGQNFNIELTTDSDTTTYQGAAYFGEDSQIELGSNAVISASGTSENLWGVRLYGDMKGNALQISTANDRTAQNPRSEEGMSVGFWTEADAEIDFSKIGIKASGAGFRTDGMMVHSSSSGAGLALIDDLQIESTNSAEDGVALGLHFYHPARDEVVNFTMEGTRLAVKATGTDSATGISNRYHNDPDDANIAVRYAQAVVEAYGTQSAVGIELARTTNSGTNTGIAFSAGECLKVVAESTEDDAMGVNLRNASLSAGKLNLSASGATAADGVYLDNSALTVTGDADIESKTLTGKARGLYVKNQNGETVSFDKALLLTAEGDEANGIYISKGKVNVGGDADITAKAATDLAYGVYATGSSQAATFNGKLNVSAEGADEETSALRADISAQITAAHGGTITSNHWAAYAYRGGKITLNSNNDTPLTILGSVKAERSSAQVRLTMGSGSTWIGNAEASSATVAVTLKDGSLWTGDGYETAYNASSGKGVLGLQLQGGTWKLTGNESSSLSLIASEGGTIDFSSLKTGTNLIVASLQTNAGETLFYTDTLHGETVAEISALTGTGGRVGIVGSSSLNDESKDKVALVEALAEEVSIPDGPDFIKVEESFVSGEVFGTIDSEGKFIVRTTESRNASDLRSAVALRARLLQKQSSGLPDRLQVIRDGGRGTVGGWASISGQEMRYSSGAHSQDASVELGFDGAVDAWVLGGSFTYVDSDIDDLAVADAEGETYVFTLYGQRNFASGAYVGTAVRYMRAETDYRFGAFDVDWKQNGWGLSLESGHRFAVGNVSFVEPKIALSYAHFDSDSFSSQNVEGDLDSFDALVGSVGLRAGFTFPENRGALYAKTSVNHDFKGEADGRIRSRAVSSDIGEDLGDTWLEYGVGGSFRITPNWNAAVDLSRTTGGEVESNWIANVSMRYVW